MTPQLFDLAGEPLSWAEAHRRVEEYWRTHERDGTLRPPPVVYSTWCRLKTHGRCDRSLARDAACTCWCHEESVDPPAALVARLPVALNGALCTADGADSDELTAAVFADSGSAATGAASGHGEELVELSRRRRGHSDNHNARPRVMDA